jgi:DNA-binding MarR family transcriptional regulator
MKKIPEKISIKKYRKTNKHLRQNRMLAQTSKNNSWVEETVSMDSRDDPGPSIDYVAAADMNAASSTPKKSEAKKLQLFANVLWKVRKNAFPSLFQRGSVIRWDTLIAIAMSENMSVSYADLEALVGRPQRTLQYIIRDLEGMGIVRTEHSPEDRRRRVVYLTDAGRVTFENYIEYIEKKLRVLTAAGYCLPSDRDHGET